MDGLSIILGNVCSIFATAADSISSTRKTTKDMLLVQSLGQLAYGIGAIILKGYSGAVQNFVSILRNFVAIKRIESKILEWVFLALGVVLGIAFNNIGFMGLLPIIANLQYTYCVFRFKDNERALKISFLVTVILFTAFNFAIWNIVGGVANSIVFVTAGIALLKDIKKNKE